MMESCKGSFCPENFWLTLFIYLFIYIFISFQERLLLYAITKCLSSLPAELKTQNLVKKGGESSQPASGICSLLEKLCVAASSGVPHYENQLGFHPIKLFRSLKKHRPDSLFPVLFARWPATDVNPFVLPVCLYSCLQSAHTPYNTAGFIQIAQAYCTRQYPGISLLVVALLLSTDPAESLRAAPRLLAAGNDPKASAGNGPKASAGNDPKASARNDPKASARNDPNAPSGNGPNASVWNDPNAITSTAILRAFASKWSRFYGQNLLDLVDQVTPLALAVASQDSALARQLLQLGANPCLVCLCSVQLTYSKIYTNHIS